MSATAAAADLRAVLQQAADATARSNDCAIAIGYFSATEQLSVAAGFSDVENTRKADPADRFVWGSVTKCVTGASVLSLVNEGKVKLSDPISKHVDPFLQRATKG